MKEGNRVRVASTWSIFNGQAGKIVRLNPADPKHVYSKETAAVQLDNDPPDSALSFGLGELESEARL